MDFGWGGGGRFFFGVPSPHVTFLTQADSASTPNVASTLIRHGFVITGIDLVLWDRTSARAFTQTAQESGADDPGKADPTSIHHMIAAPAPPPLPPHGNCALACS